MESLIQAYSDFLLEAPELFMVDVVVLALLTVVIVGWSRSFSRGLFTVLFFSVSGAVIATRFSEMDPVAHWILMGAPFLLLLTLGFALKSMMAPSKTKTCTLCGRVIKVRSNPERTAFPMGWSSVRGYAAQCAKCGWVAGPECLATLPENQTACPNCRNTGYLLYQPLKGG